MGEGVPKDAQRAYDLFARAGALGLTQGHRNALDIVRGEDLGAPDWMRAAGRDHAGRSGVRAAVPAPSGQFSAALYATTKRQRSRAARARHLFAWE